MWEAVAVNGFTCARAAATNELMIVKSTSEIGAKQIVVERSGRPLTFSIDLEPKYKDMRNIGPDNPTIKFTVGDFILLLRDRSGSHAQNTDLIRHLISGVAAINRKWPLSISPYFYSDLDNYEKEKLSLLSFSFPSNEELALIQT